MSSAVLMRRGALLSCAWFLSSCQRKQWQITIHPRTKLWLCWFGWRSAYTLEAKEWKTKSESLAIWRTQVTCSVGALPQNESRISQRLQISDHESELLDFPHTHCKCNFTNNRIYDSTRRLRDHDHHDCSNTCHGAISFEEVTRIETWWCVQFSRPSH